MRSSTLAFVCLASCLLAPGCMSHAAYPSPAVEPAPHPMYQRAERAYLLGDHQESLTLFRAYRKGHAPRGAGAWAWYWEGQILLEQGEGQAAETAFEKAVSSSYHPLLEALSYTGLGDCAFADTRYEEATAHYQRVLDLKVPEARNDYVLYRLGVTRQRRGDWGGGLSYLQHLLAMHPQSPLKEKAEARIAFPARLFYYALNQHETETQARAALQPLIEQGLRGRVVSLQDGGPYLVLAGGYMTHAEAVEQKPGYAQALEIENLPIVP
ncbi:MAG: tetratricopeptide repeat protein [Planctomycetota bacterium]